MGVALLTHREWLVQHVDAMPPGMQDVDLSLVDSLVVPASLHDVDGRFVHLNAAAERAIGFSRAQLLGRHFTEPVPQEARKNVAEQFRRAVECGEPTDFETVFIDASGQLRGVRAQHLPLCSGDAIVGVLILAFAARRPPSVGLDPQPRLTPRQREILNLIAAGLSTSEMAEKLSISTETVRNHLRSIFTELDVHTRLEAIATAQRLGLLAPPALGPQPPSKFPFCRLTRLGLARSQGSAASAGVGDRVRRRVERGALRRPRFLGPAPRPAAGPVARS